MSFKTDKYNDVLDENLIQLILKGNKEALNSLINRHKDWVYNVALRMTGNHHESDDVTQEILIKIVTKLSTFKFNSSFKTWLYRITVNHVLSMRKMGKEGYFSSFEKHEKFFENLPNEELGDKYSIDKKMLIEETKVECMLGMLLCLDREQRIVFILGGIFGVESKFGSEILEITESNFRKRLSRARGELKNYMTDNCSLLNPENSCKCTKKTKAAIEQGYVNPEKLQFSDEHMERVKERVERSDITVDDMKELRFQQLFREHPYKIFETSEFSEFMGGM